MKSVKSLFSVAAIGLILVPLLMMGWKISQGYFSAHQLLPQTAFRVQYDFALDSLQGAKEIFVKTYVPQTNLHQKITAVTMGGSGFNLSHESTLKGQQLTWKADELLDSASHLTYSFEYRGQAIAYEIDSSLAIHQQIPDEITPWLQPGEYIQSSDQRILAQMEQLLGDKLDMVSGLDALYGHVMSLGELKTSALTDAVLALEQGAASCNGKSRLFVALCRAAGIPARVVGGIILQHTEKRTSHLWAEAYVQGQWIPFDPLNGHFASLPSNYLELYRGDDFLIKRTAGIGFDYMYSISSQDYVSPAVKSDYTLWALPLQAALPISLLRLILLLPICVFIVALLKNVVGIKTFGVFLPAIIAMAMADVGFLDGAVIYCFLIAVVGLVHYPLERWGLLYTPRLVALLIAMVGTLLFVTYLGIGSTNSVLSAVIFFPIIVSTIAAERFARTIVEDGYKEAVQLQLQTLLVTFCCYLVYTADFLPGYFLTFPETYALLLGLVLLLGRWIGLRVTEYHRFHWVVS